MINFNFLAFITNQFFLLFLAIALGLIIGNVRIKNFKLGASGVLFAGLGISWLLQSWLMARFGVRATVMPTMVKASLDASLVSKNFFLFSLILFISSVGLIAGKNFTTIFKKYGSTFPVMAAVVTIAGYLSAWVLKLLLNIDPKVATGIFTGSLTSSPGLGTALENAGGTIAEANIGLGYALAYIPGVLGVIFSMYFLPKIFKIDVAVEQDKFLKSIDVKEKETNNFDLAAYGLVVVVGLLISKISFSLGPVQGLSLGVTGGTLLSALMFGVIKKWWLFNFEMNTAKLKLLQKLGLLMFLASIGLRYGYTALSGLDGQGLIYLLMAFAVVCLSVLIGFLIGRFVFKMNWIILAGAICGGMTSTPGLGAAIDATGTDQTAASYGAVYPFALLGMVLLVLLGF